MTDEQVNPIAQPEEAAHRQEDLQRFKTFLKDFAQESDRAAVILGASRLDEGLYQLLAATLLPHTGSTDDLLDSEKALGTFSARIHLAYRLGLLDADLTRSLHLIRRIRNAFAHQASGATLESGPHADRIRELVRPFRQFTNYADARHLVAKEHQGLSAEFRTVLAVLSARLESAFNGSARIDSNATAMIPPVWQKHGDS